MAKLQHVEILKQGTRDWNEWRDSHPDVVPDLSGADLRRLDLDASYPGSPRFYRSDECPWMHYDIKDLGPVNLRGADLSHADVCGARLFMADFSGANLRGVRFHDAHAAYATFRKAKLCKAQFGDTCLQETVFVGADLRGATLYNVDLENADLSGANLNWAKMDRANLRAADLRSAKLRHTDLSEACLLGADLTNAKLTRAVLKYTNLAYACLRKADLTGADLTCANLASACLDGAVLANCLVYGVSAWGASFDGTEQRELTVSLPEPEIVCVRMLFPGDTSVRVPIARPKLRKPYPVVTFDELEALPFVDAVLRNAALDEVVGTIDSNVVLILGQFTGGRRDLLTSFRELLRQRGYMPIALDFGVIPPDDVDAMVLRLSRLARFVIADISESPVLPYQVKNFIVNQRPVPLAVFLSEGTQLCDDALFDGLKRFSHVLERQDYSNHDEACQKLAQVMEKWERS